MKSTWTWSLNLNGSSMVVYSRLAKIKEPVWGLKMISNAHAHQDLQVILYQNDLFIHQLTQNMTSNCWEIYQSFFVFVQNPKFKTLPGRSIVSLFLFQLLHIKNVDYFLISLPVILISKLQALLLYRSILSNAFFESQKPY